MSQTSKKYSADVEQKLHQAVALHQAGDFAAARPLYENCLEQDGKNPDALHLLGLICLQEKEYQRAEELVKQAVALWPDNPTFHNSLGSVYEKMRRYGDAVTSFRKAVELMPNYLDAYSNLGSVLLEMHNFDEAANALATVLEVAPTHLHALNTAALLYLKIGQHQKAERYCREVIRQAPQDSLAYINLAKALEWQGKDQDALKHYAHALELVPSSVDAAKGVALVLARLQHIPEAVQALEKVIEVDPDDHEAKHLLSSLKGEDVKTVNPDYIARLFDEYAHNFEEHLTKTLRYQGPEILLEKLKELAALEESAGWRVMDLGCGTGLCGVLLKPFSSWLGGVDLSSRMIEASREKDVYDFLETGEMVEVLQKIEQPLNLLIAADVFVYVGDLEDVFKVSTQKLEAGGYFIFCLELLGEDGTYKLMPTGRFMHSEAYINELAEKHGFEVLAVDHHELRRHGETSIPGGYIYCRKK